ncbi:MAG TPA: hypothetical protein VK689_20680 [Armatimonadota bacterium]|nr:hypothetical protein [Armatimonadota bacterium]
MNQQGFIAAGAGVVLLLGHAWAGTRARPAALANKAAPHRAVRGPKPAVQVIHAGDVPRLTPAEEAPGRGVPEDDPRMDRKFETRGFSEGDDYDFPAFEVLRRDPGTFMGRSYGPGTTSVQARLSPGEAQRRKRPSHLWSWGAPERYQKRWAAFSEAYTRRGVDRYLAMVTYAPDWKEAPTLLLFDSKARGVANRDTPPLWDVEIPLEPFYAAASAHNEPRHKRLKVDASEDRHRAEVSVTPDGKRILVMLQPEPDTSKSGLWLFDGQGNLLKVLVFPGRYEAIGAGSTATPALARSARGGLWRLTLSRPRLEADVEEGRDSPRGLRVVEESYLVDASGAVMARAVTGQGRNLRLAPNGSGDFSTNDRWVYGEYTRRVSGQWLPIACYYDLRRPLVLRDLGLIQLPHQGSR